MIFKVKFTVTKVRYIRLGKLYISYFESESLTEPNPTYSISSKQPNRL